MEIGHESAQQTLLARIPDRIASWKCTQDQIESHGRAPGTDLLNGQVIDSAALEAEELLMGSARCGRHDAQTQPRADPGGSRVAAEALERLVGPAPAAICGALSGAHRSIVR